MAPDTATMELSSKSFFLVRIIFLRAMAFVYFVAFLVAYHQNKPLIGDNGITPARYALNEAQERGRIKQQRRLAWRNANESSEKFAVPLREGMWGYLSQTKAVRRLGKMIDDNPRLLHLREVLWDRSDRMGRPITSLLWLAKDRNKLDRWLDFIALTGLSLSTVIFLIGAANVPMVFVLWLCQRSLMAVGGPWYGFGWEPQLAELSFHAMFLVPLLSLNPLPSMPVPPPVQWTIKWYLFRIMIGAGLIKLKSGDKKWKDLTSMDYFYETQPVPNPITRYMHWMPKAWHRGEVLFNHFIELISPWLLVIPFLPPFWRRLGGVMQLAFQAVLISTGNLSFLNWLTMVPAIMCLDDAFVGGLFSKPFQKKAALVASNSQLFFSRRVVSWLFLGLIAQLSIPVVRNLLAKRQVMNASFDPLRLVNTYGAFGTVNENRDEFIISSSSDLENWKEYEFKVKPGNVYKHPRFISPYHYRLDWQMWIAAVCRSLDRSPWIFKFLLKLLQQDEGVLSLLEGDPWKDSTENPRYIRIDMYRYKFHRPVRGEKNPPYWDRMFLGRVYPRLGVASVESLKDEIKNRLPTRSA